MNLIDRIAYNNRLAGRSGIEKTSFALGMLMLALVLPPWPGDVLVFAVMVTATLLVARVPLRPYLGLLAAPLTFLVIGIVPLLLSVSLGGPWLIHVQPAQGGLELALRVSLRSMAGVSCLFFLSLSTPVPQVLAVLRTARVPRELTEVALLVYRYTWVSVDTIRAMRAAQTSRLGYRSLRSSYRSLGMLVAVLFGRTLQRARAMQHGLEARNWQGELRVLDQGTAAVSVLAMALIVSVQVLTVARGGAVADRVTAPILVAEDLRFEYDGGFRGLDGLGLTVERGRRMALVGANGAGKTTLLLHLNGTLKPQAGAVRVNGAPADYSRAGLTRWRQVVGLVFQNPDDQLFAGTVAQDVSFGPLNLGLSDDETRRRVDDALAALDISELSERPTHMLSYGQKKRAAIAGALAMRPEVLIIDEPLAGLDPSGAEHLDVVLRRLHAAGTTLILATHDMSLACAWADEVAVMREGTITAQGDPRAVMGDAELLHDCGLRVPWVLEVAAALRSRGVLAESDPAPRSREALLELLDGAPSASPSLAFSERS